MSKTIIFALVVTMAVAVLSAPAEHQFEAPEEVEPPTLTEVEAGPQARITCGLLSGIGWAHSFCAAHCLFLGYKGGRCNNKGVCECRN